MHDTRPVRSLALAALMVVFSLLASTWALPPREGGSSCETCKGPAMARYCSLTTSGGYEGCDDYYGQCTVTGALCTVEP